MVLAIATDAAAQTVPQRQNQWYVDGQNTVAERERRKVITGPARNVILFIGDGMGPATVAAARMLEGQRRGASGEENLLSFERLPHVAVAKTYNTDAQTPDSAGSATAILSGVKTRRGVVGVDGDVVVADCASGRANEVASFLELAESADFATGVVTTSQITDATPAAAYAHGPTDRWEVDTAVPPAAVEAGCIDFAAQLVTPSHGDGPYLVFGGGGRNFLLEGSTSPDGRIEGIRADGRNLVDEWLSHSPGAKVVWSAGEIERQAAEPGPVLGLFSSGYMQFETDRERMAPQEPSLSTMTAVAIDRLEATRTRYFLLVEGGRIDQAHHVNNAARALGETIEFANAVQVALDNTVEADTLIIVTADHDQSMVFAGEATRGNPVLGLANMGTADDGKPHTSIYYSSGPSGAGPLADESSRRLADDGQRADPRKVDTGALNYRQYSAFTTASGTHGPGDVLVYARGPGAHLLDGVVEQNYLFHVMLRASRLHRPETPADDHHVGR
jgi:alkaline phosphatase